MSSTNNNRLFSSIATRYDLLNHLLSLNIDQSWRKELIKCAGVKPGESILDVCTGTGDIAIRFARMNSCKEIVGIDWSDEMLHLARRKIMKRGLDRRIKLLNANALCLPFDDSFFDVVSIGFGLRNLTDRKKGISEMARMLRKGGRMLILEFSPPADNLFGMFYNLCLNTMIPVVGGIVSGSASAYRYLSTSIVSFLKPEEITELMEQAGLKNVWFKSLTGGIAYIYKGEK